MVRDYTRLAEQARQIMRQKPDVIVAAGSVSVRAAQRATAVIPIVMAPAADPVGSGFVATLARPGRNITGLSSALEDYIPKQVELLKILDGGTRECREKASLTVGARARYGGRRL